MVIVRDKREVIRICESMPVLNRFILSIVAAFQNTITSIYDLRKRDL